MANWNAVLPQPSDNDIQEGRYTHVRFVRNEASVAAPVVWTSVSGVQEVNIDPVSWGSTNKYFQFGAGDESLEKKLDPETSMTISFLNGEGFNQLAAFLGQTWTAAETTGLPYFQENDYPDIIVELVAKEANNSTHLYSHVFPDATIQGFGFQNVMDTTNWSLTFKTKREPFVLANGVEAVYDQFTGDGSTTDFTLSATPLAIVTATNQRYWDYDNFAFIKEKASTASIGTLQHSGYTNTTTTLTATTAPAASTIVQVLYAKVQA